MDSSKFDAMMTGLRIITKNVEGEIYNFASLGKKKSAKNARKALSEMKKLCFQFRKEILDTLKAMPVKKRSK
jgi:hypothetical protein